MPKAAEFLEEALREALKAGASEAIVISDDSLEHMVRFSNNEVTVAKTWITSSLSILLVFNGKRIIAHVEELSSNSIREAIERAKKSAQYLPQPTVEAPLPREGKFTSEVEIQAPDIGEVVHVVEEAIAGSLIEGIDRAAGVATDGISEIHLLSSTGCEGVDRRRGAHLSVRVFSKDGGSGQLAECATAITKINAKALGAEAAQLASVGSKPVEGDEGVYDVVLGPMVVANLFNEVASLASAFYVEAGLSFLAQKMGKQVASPKITLIDDATLPDAPASRLFDGEGTPSKRVTIIKEGVLQNYLHNVVTAKKFGVESTGHAGWVVPEPSNIILEAGTISLEEMLSELDNGIYVTNNWYTRFQNYSSGDFSTICRDALLLVKRGEVMRSLRGLRISDNLERMIKSVEGVSKDRRWISWWEAEHPVLAPYLLVKSVRFTRAQS